MQVIDGLATISPCIDYQAITTLGDSLLFSKLAGHNDQPAQGWLIWWSSLINGIQVVVGNNQNMDRRNGMDIIKRGYQIVVVDDLSWNLSGDNPAKNAFWVHKREGPCGAIIFVRFKRGWLEISG